MDLRRRILVEIDGTGSESGARKVNNSLQSIERQAKQMSSGGSRAFDDLKGSIGGLSRFLPIVASGFAALKLGELAKESALLAARYDTLGVVMNVVGNNAGYTSGQMAAFQAGLQKTGISMIESRNNLARMAQANMDLAKSSNLARIAQDAAVIGNINSSQAFERLVYGIQSGQTEVLKTIGINVNFEQSYKKLATQLDKNASQLTESEKTQARMNSVMEGGAKIAGTYEAAMDTAGKQISSLDRLSENAKVKLGDLFQPALVTGVKLYTLALKEANEQLDMMVRLKNATGEATTSGELARRVLAAQQTADDQVRFQAENAKPGTEKWNQYQKLIDQAQASVARLRGEMTLLGEEERSTARLQGYRADQNKKKLLEEEKSASALLASTTKQTEAERMLLSVREDVAEMTMSDAELARFKISEEYAKMAKELGAANPELKKWVELKEREAKYSALATLKPYQVTELEAMNRGDMFYGKADADKRGLELLQDTSKENLELQTEFSEKYRQVVLGETEFKLDQIRLQGEAYVKAGSDEVAVAQWVAAEKLKVSRDWTDGVKRGLQGYADDATNAARQAENAITSGFKGMEDALVSFVTTGKLEFSDLANSIISDLARIAIQQTITGPLASGAGDFISSLLGGSSSAAAGSAGGGFNFAGEMSSFFSTHHSGGIVGSEATSMRLASPMLFAGASRFHSGGIVGDEVPIIAKRKEGVFTEGQMKALGGGGGGDVSIVVHNNAPGTEARATAKDDGNGGKTIEITIDELNGKNIGRHGSSSDRALRSRFALNPVLTGR